MKNRMQVEDLDNVLRYYAKAFDRKSGEGEIASIEWYVDPVREVVIFDFLIREPGDAPGLDSNTEHPPMGAGRDLRRLRTRT